MREFDERQARYLVWYMAQTRTSKRWFIASQALAVGVIVLALGQAYGVPGWLWTVSAAGSWVCRRAWRESHRRLMDGMGHYSDYLRASIRSHACRTNPSSPKRW